MMKASAQASLTIRCTRSMTANAVGNGNAAGVEFIAENGGDLGCG